ncbi:uncharacterized protein LOC141614734 [Silene latifolia]|uniref:uncharacterized protein LOC141614734 n=1 Tax=Silene latifolia TaxID=37657 RepID=UPI003D782C07
MQLDSPLHTQAQKDKKGPLARTTVGDNSQYKLTKATLTHRCGTSIENLDKPSWLLQPSFPTLTLYAFELLLKLVEPEETPDFPRLSRLYLGNCHYAWEYMISLLDKSPQLEIVVFGWGLEDCDHESQSLPNEPLPSFSCHAKVIEVNRFVGSEYALLYVGHLLRNAGALKKLILRKFHTVDMEKELRICKVLLTLPKASKDCCIELISAIPPWD